MTERLLSLEKYPQQDLYFHNVFGESRRDVIMGLRNGHPLFCLRGRATLNRGKPIIRGTSLAFFIPETEASEVIEPIYPSPFEDDDAEKFPSYFTFVQRVPAEHISAAEQWIRSQQEIPTRPEFLSATVDDVRILPSRYFLSEY